MNKTYWKALFVLATLLVGFLWLSPSISFYGKDRAEQEKLRDRRNPILGKILNLGLDLQGGIHLLLELRTDALPDDRPETLREAVDRAIEVVRNRIDQYGLSEPLIVRQGDKFQTAPSQNDTGASARLLRERELAPCCRGVLVVLGDQGQRVMRARV